MILGPRFSRRPYETFKQTKFAITEKKSFLSSHVQFCVSVKVKPTDFLNNFARKFLSHLNFSLEKEVQIVIHV